MKMRQLFSAVLAALALGAAGASRADVIVSDSGDADGFGIGVAIGASFDSDDLGAGDGDGTDEWRYGDFSFAHVYAITGGPIASARLELVTGGYGLDGRAGLYLNGSFVGLLSQGEIAAAPFNAAVRDVFDLTPYAALLTGNDSFEVRLEAGVDDGGVRDYSRLTVVTGVAAAVPEPGTATLVGLGVAALGIGRRRGRRT